MISLILAFLYWISPFDSINVFLKSSSVFTLLWKYPSKNYLPFYLIGDVLIELYPIKYCIPFFILGNILKIRKSFHYLFIVIFLDVLLHTDVYILYILSHLFVLKEQKSIQPQVCLIVSDIIILIGSFYDTNTKLVTWPLYYYSIN